MGLIKYVDTSNLPRKGKCIDWEKSIGYQCSFIYGNLHGEIKIIDRKTKKYFSYLTIEYKNNISEISANSFLHGAIGIAIGVINSDFRYNIGDVVKQKNQDLKIIDREIRTNVNRDGKTHKWKWYKIECQNCFKTHWIVENAIVHGTGCPFCINSHLVVEGVNDIPTTDPWMIDYFQGGTDEAKQYTHCSGKEIYPKCPICGKIAKKKMAIFNLYKYRSIGCQCDGKMSFPELILYNILDQNNIDFIPQASKSTFSWVKLYRYDFYLPKYNCIIETHGCQHYKMTKLKGRTLDEEQQNDINKKQLAISNGIKNYFEVDCRNSYIKWIVNSCETIGLFDFLGIDPSKINFDKLYYNKFHDKIKECKQILASNPDICFADLKRKLNLKHQYDLERILDILMVKVKSNHYHMVDVYKDNDLIATYPSMAQLLKIPKTIEYWIGSHASLKKYIENNLLYKNHYLFKYHDQETEVVIC